MNSPIIFNTNQLVILNTLYQKYLENAFVATNRASGTTSATLNTRSGVVTFTQNIPASTLANYSISNSNVTSSTKVEVFIQGDMGTTSGILNYMGYQCSNGAIDLFFYNLALSDAFDVDIVVSFRLLN